jgi:hypothetical protein
MATYRTPRPAFKPEALSAFDVIFDEVWNELVADGSLQPTNVNQTRTRLARKVLAFASSGWSEIQVRQLLLRAFRNEAARNKRVRRRQSVTFAAMPWSAA